jgi:hypothetical protein
MAADDEALVVMPDDSVSVVDLPPPGDEHATSIIASAAITAIWHNQRKELCRICALSSHVKPHP